MSKPSPPSNVSLPAPPSRLSWPLPARNQLVVALPIKKSSPSPLTLFSMVDQEAMVCETD
ncbi:hypothetical protein B9Z50_00015 [Limnohabitans sp. Bal53]|nr:hypothetical protein B9Z50_00015 [Limnohabitans sp. Bal53]